MSDDRLIVALDVPNVVQGLELASRLGDAVSFYKIEPVASVLVAMALGSIGFPLLLDGAAYLFRARIGMKGP